MAKNTNGTTATAGKPALNVRVGIETGSVVVDAAGEIYGDAPNTAARVQAQAEPGTVLITADVQRQIAGLFVAEKLRDQRQIEALAGLRGAVGNPADQLVAQGAQVGAFERHRRQPGKADSVRARIARKAGRDILTIHEMHPSV